MDESNGSDENEPISEIDSNLIETETVYEDFFYTEQQVETMSNTSEQGELYLSEIFILLELKRRKRQLND